MSDSWSGEIETPFNKCGKSKLWAGRPNTAATPQLKICNNPHKKKSQSHCRVLCEFSKRPFFFFVSLLQASQPLSSPPSPLPRVCQAPWAGHGWQSAWKPADIVPDERSVAWNCSASKCKDKTIIDSLFSIFYFLSFSGFIFVRKLTHDEGGVGCNLFAHTVCADYTPAFTLLISKQSPNFRTTKDQQTVHHFHL